MSIERILTYYMRELSLVDLRCGLSDAELSINDMPQLVRRWRGLEEESYSWSSEDETEVHRWIRSRSASLVPTLFRVIDLTDDEVAELLGAEDLPRGRGTLHVHLRFNPRAQPPAGSAVLNLADLAAGSALLMELYVAVAAAHLPFGQRLSPPDVEVRSGSVQFTTSGSLLPAGLGLVVAASAGMIASPLALPAGGLLAVTGAVDICLSWMKAVEERRKLRAERGKFSAEELKLKAEVRKLNAETARLDFERLSSMRGRGKATDAEPIAASSMLPPSAAVPRPIVADLAAGVGASEAYDNHMINRALPTAAAVRQVAAELDAHHRRDDDHHPEARRRRRSPQPNFA